MCYNKIFLNVPEQRITDKIKNSTMQKDAYSNKRNPSPIYASVF